MAGEKELNVQKKQQQTQQQMQQQDQQIQQSVPLQEQERNEPVQGIRIEHEQHQQNLDLSLLQQEQREEMIPLPGSRIAAVNAARLIEEGEIPADVQEEMLHKADEIIEQQKQEEAEEYLGLRAMFERAGQEQKQQQRKERQEARQKETLDVELEEQFRNEEYDFQQKLVRQEKHLMTVAIVPYRELQTELNQRALSGDSPTFKKVRECMDVLMRQFQNQDRNAGDCGDALHELHQAAVQYYNAHRGHRWGAKTSRRKQLIKRIVSQVHATMLDQDVEENIRDVALEKLLMDNGKDGWKNKLSREFMRGQEMRDVQGELVKGADENSFRLINLIRINARAARVMDWQMKYADRLNEKKYMDARILNGPLTVFRLKRVGENQYVPLQQKDADLQREAEEKLKLMNHDDLEVRKNVIDALVEKLQKWEFHPNMLTKEWILDHYAETRDWTILVNAFDDNVSGSRARQEHRAYYHTYPESVRNEIRLKLDQMSKVNLFKNIVEGQCCVNQNGNYRDDEMDLMDIRDEVKDEHLGVRVNALYERYWKGEQISYNEVLKLFRLYDLNDERVVLTKEAEDKLYILKRELESGEQGQLASLENQREIHGFAELHKQEGRRYRRLTQERYRNLPELPDEAFYNGSHLDEMKKLADWRKNQMKETDERIEAIEQQILDKKLDMEAKMREYAGLSSVDKSEQKDDYQEELKKLRKDIKDFEKQLSGLEKERKNKDKKDGTGSWDATFAEYVKLVGEHAVLSTEASAMAHEAALGVYTKKMENGSMTETVTKIEDKKKLRALEKEVTKRRKQEKSMLEKIRKLHNKLARKAGMPEPEKLEAELLLADQMSERNKSCADHYGRKRVKIHQAVVEANMNIRKDVLKEFEALYQRYQKVVGISTQFSINWLFLLKTESREAGLSEDEIKQNEAYNDQMLERLKAIFIQDADGNETCDAEQLAKIYEEKMDFLLAMPEEEISLDGVKMAAGDIVRERMCKMLHLLFGVEDERLWGNLAKAVREKIPEEKQKLLEQYATLNSGLAIAPYYKIVGYDEKGLLNTANDLYSMKQTGEEEYLKPARKEMLEFRRKKVYDAQKKKDQNPPTA